MIKEAEMVLKKLFGFPALRDVQRPVVARLLTPLEGVNPSTVMGRMATFKARSSIAVLPTGGGKSLLYQLPALLLPHTTIVVSPLLALMKDQIDSLRSKGIPAAMIDSTTTHGELAAIGHSLESGKLKLLYVSPERLDNKHFLTMLKRTSISLLAVDESHAVLEWGNTFRPAYLKVAKFATEVKAHSILCITATAPQNVLETIRTLFNIPEEGVFKVQTARKNLHLHVKEVGSDPKLEVRADLLVKLLRRPERRGATIVYASTRRDTHFITDLLRDAGLNVRVYHAGLSYAERVSNQEWFMKDDGKTKIIVATIAFGMGIDKHDIRNVIHISVPRSIESWSQEFGRAGRDGNPSFCLLFLSDLDKLSLHRAAWYHRITPSQVSSWIHGEFLPDFKSRDAGSIYEADIEVLSHQYGINPSTLAMLYTQLEITEQFAWVKALSRWPSMFEFMSADGQDLPQNKATALFRQDEDGWYRIDKDALLASNTTRKDVAHIIDKLDKERRIKARPSQWAVKYRIEKKLQPKEVEAGGQYLVDILMDQYAIEDRKLEEVFDIARSQQCLTAGIAQYFGDHVSPCGICSTCKNHLLLPIPKKKLALKRPATSSRLTLQGASFQVEKDKKAATR